MLAYMRTNGQGVDLIFSFTVWLLKLHDQTVISLFHIESNIVASNTLC